MIGGEKTRDIYIKQTDIINLFRSYVQPGAYRDQFIEIIRCIPAYDVEPVKRWVPVSGVGYPKTGCDILMYGAEIYKGYFDTEINRFRLDDGYIIGGITHWMPLPDPPEGGKQQYD